MKSNPTKRPAVFAGSAALLLLVLASSCTTTPYSQREGNVQKAIDLIHAGDADRLVSQSELPFLFDAEIIMLERDLRTLWENLSEAEFTMENFEVEYIGPAGRYSYPPFADSMEVRTFFKKYVPEQSAIVRVIADNGEFFLLLGPEEDEAPTFIGYRMNI
jgi:hypothetical protein